MKRIIRKIAEWTRKLRGATKRFSFRLIVSFIFISIIPLLLIQIMSYYMITSSMRDNINDLINLNLHQTRTSLDAMLTGYEDLLYQIYTDEDLVANMKHIGADHETAVNTNQLRRRLAGYCDAKPMIQSITMIASNGQVVTYDKMSPTTYESSWLGAYREQHPDVYQDIWNSEDPLIFSSGEATRFGLNTYYLFHMAYRIVDILNVYQDVGVVVVSIDATLLDEICNEVGGTERTSVNFLVNADGQVVSYPILSAIGTDIKVQDSDRYINLVKGSDVMAGNHISVATLQDDLTGWTIVHAADQTALYSGIASQQRIMLFSIILVGAVLIGTILMTSKRLSGSLAKVAKAITSAGEGELSVRIDPDRHMAAEVQTISRRFNQMLSEINILINDVKDATMKQKEAEIRALESQINPHFMYNTLDTINWIAIDRDQYEISNMISSLAKILRYAVDKSNAVVTVREEIDWMRTYVFLQQARLKNAFECTIDFDESILDCSIRKLLIQPFVENAIVHGFSGQDKKSILAIEIRDHSPWLQITITDSGVGIPPRMIELVNQRKLPDSGEKSHIGIRNVQDRLEMYYGPSASVAAESNLKGTRIVIKIPKIQQGAADQ
jgi:two-component system sensor histidine kinase YesM